MPMVQKERHIAHIYRRKKGAELSKSALISHKIGVKSQVTSKISKDSSEPTHSVEITIVTGADTDASAYT